MWLEESNAAFSSSVPSRFINKSKASSRCVLLKCHLFSAGFSPVLLCCWTSCCLTWILGFIAGQQTMFDPQPNAFGILLNSSMGRIFQKWDFLKNFLEVLYTHNKQGWFCMVRMLCCPTATHELGWCTTPLHDADQLLNGWLYATPSPLTGLIG